MYRLPPAVSSQSSSRASRAALARTTLVVATLASLFVVERAESQTAAAPASAWEFRLASGAFVPTGALRRSVKNADLSAAQLSWAVRPSLALTATLGWARSRDIASIDAPKLDVFTADLGVEARAGQWFEGRKVTFSPFVGAGAGAQSYNSRALNIAATNNAGAYGTVGGELGMGRVGVRLEVRDYASGFKPLSGAGKSGMRNNVVAMIALRFNHARPSAAK